MTALSGTRDGWTPAVLPLDAVARRELLEWIDDQDRDRVFNVLAGDFRGADLSGAPFVGVYLLRCDLRGVSFRGADLVDGRLFGATIEEADFTGALMSKSDVGGASMVGAVFDGANMISAEIGEADARRTSFRGANLMGARTFNLDLRGADLSAALVGNMTLRARVDSTTRFAGMSGDLWAVLVVEEEGLERVLELEELEDYLLSRGAQVRIKVPRRA